MVLFSVFGSVFWCREFNISLSLCSPSSRHVSNAPHFLTLTGVGATVGGRMNGTLSASTAWVGLDGMAVVTSSF